MIAPDKRDFRQLGIGKKNCYKLIDMGIQRMPTKEELERLPLMWLAGVCKRISDADDASSPVAAREEAQKLCDEYLAIQVTHFEHGTSGAATTRMGDNYKAKEADLKTRTVAFLWRTDKLFHSLSCLEKSFPKSW